jgi:hypothetical protein
MSHFTRHFIFGRNELRDQVAVEGSEGGNNLRLKEALATKRKIKKIRKHCDFQQNPRKPAVAVKNVR